jgi:hypothetical protein
VKEYPLKRDLRWNLDRFDIGGVRRDLSKRRDSLRAFAFREGQIIDNSHRERIEDPPPTSNLIRTSLAYKEEENRHLLY